MLAKCNAGHRLPDVVAYVYPHGTLVCVPCQTWDAHVNGGSPTVILTTTDGEVVTTKTFAVKRYEFASLPQPHSRCAWCQADLPAPCAACDPVGAEARRRHSIKCIPRVHHTVPESTTIKEV